MKYRGFEVVSSYLEVKKQDIEQGIIEKYEGFYCQIYPRNCIHEEYKLVTFELIVGTHISENSQLACERGIMDYINRVYNGLQALRREKMEVKKNNNWRGALQWISEQVRNDKELYNTLFKVIGLTQEEIIQSGYEKLIPYFDKKLYAQEIADYIIGEKADWEIIDIDEFDYEKIHRKYGVDLSNEQKLLKKVQKSIAGYLKLRDNLNKNQDLLLRILPKVETMERDNLLKNTGCRYQKNTAWGRIDISISKTAPAYVSKSAIKKFPALLKNKRTWEIGEQNKTLMLKKDNDGREIITKKAHGNLFCPRNIAEEFTGRYELEEQEDVLVLTPL